MKKRVFVVAGEVSGDTHGAELLSSLLARLEAECTGLGGPRMRAEAPGIEDWLDQAAVLGIAEVLKKYNYFRHRLRHTLETLEETQPDLLVLIDYPGFNLRLAKALRRRGRFRGKVAYYISPQVWAWKRGRIREMARTLDLMLCIFPFEKALYEESGLTTEFVGHPLVDELASKRDSPVARDPELVGIFPGSRRREIEALFPEMAAAASRLKADHPQLHFVTAAVNANLAERLQELARNAGVDIEVARGDIHRLMQKCGCAAIASGTATLEAAFFGLPYCLVYKVAPLTAWIGRMVMKVDYLGIVNNLAGEEVVDELLQEQATGPEIARCLEQFLADRGRREALTERLLAISGTLGDSGTHDRAAVAIGKLLAA